VVGPEGLLRDGQRALVEGFRFGVLALGAVEQCELAGAFGENRG
jgi:hypothetical protein